MNSRAGGRTSQGTHRASSRASQGGTRWPAGRRRAVTAVTATAATAAAATAPAMAGGPISLVTLDTPSVPWMDSQLICLRCSQPNTICGPAITTAAATAVTQRRASARRDWPGRGAAMRSAIVTACPASSSSPKMFRTPTSATAAAYPAHHRRWQPCPAPSARASR